MDRIHKRLNPAELAAVTALLKRRPSDYAPPRSPHTLQAYTQFDFARATSWQDLFSRLKEKGYLLACDGAEVVLLTLDGEILCGLSQINQSGARLRARLGAFPSGGSGSTSCPVTHH
ncbi:hypothetical protein [Celeribacter litoreus]|uniref:hypothetical protein n=1 Tax=Celeribacter litoreus TaxID=2876714 RepID=UPI001CCDC37F|nr:hypothetical protein [Celeribacter litoreus]MCA0042042.1 hypothetical protein [Celeribacter litoreus]